MVIRIAFVLLLLPASLERLAAEPLAQIDAETAPTRVTIAPSGEGRTFVQLPALEFRLNITAQCNSDNRPASLSVSIADTRKTLLDVDIPDDASIVIDMAIPASQIAPIPVNEFCSSDTGQPQEMLVRDAVTAHLSLLCRSDSGQETITYSTRPLSVAIACENDAQGYSDSELLMPR